MKAFLTLWETTGEGLRSVTGFILSAEKKTGTNAQRSEDREGGYTRPVGIEKTDATQEEIPGLVKGPEQQWEKQE